MIRSDEEWVKLCHFDDHDELCFTDEYLELTKELGWGARKFAAHLITHWDLEFQNILDYFGDPDLEEDEYSGHDGDPMDVKHDVTDLWEYYEKACDGLDGEWYRDVLRSKLATLQLPKRVIEEYVKCVKKTMFKE